MDAPFCLRWLENPFPSGAVGLLECAPRIRGSHLHGPGLRPRDSLIFGIDVGARVGACGVCRLLGNIQMRSFIALRPRWKPRLSISTCTLMKGMPAATATSLNHLCCPEGTAAASLRVSSCYPRRRTLLSMMDSSLLCASMWTAWASLLHTLLRPAAQCGDETSAMVVGNVGQNFGSHTLDTSTRPSGPMNNTDVEAHFTTNW